MAQSLKDLCRGGPSWGCKKIDPHEPKLKAYCRRCRTYLGCFLCRQRDSELVCLNCHDWALLAGVKEHGKMVNQELAAAKVKELIKAI